MLLVKGAPSTKRPTLKDGNPPSPGVRKNSGEQVNPALQSGPEVRAQNLKKEQKKEVTKLWQISYRKPM
jgi:hypothetical protein